MRARLYIADLPRMVERLPLVATALSACSLHGLILSEGTVKLEVA